MAETGSEVDRATPIIHRVARVWSILFVFYGIIGGGVSPGVAVPDQLVANSAGQRRPGVNRWRTGVWSAGA